MLEFLKKFGNGKTDKKTKKSTSSGFALALWVLAALVLLVFFLANQGKIAANLKSTGFFNRAFGKTPAFIENAPEPKTASENLNEVPPVALTESDDNLEISLEEPEEEEPQPVPSAYEETTHEETAYKEPAKPEVKETAQTEKPAPQKKEEPKPAPKKETPVKKEAAVTAEIKPQTMKLKLFFMTVNSSGSVIRREVTREMKKSDSPLMDAVNALIRGPSPDEENSGCMSLVSPGTRLIGASVRNGTATLNFSAEFEFNQYGVEGTRGQLQQIVWTATAFPTVQNVQFLVEGEKKEYLGGEGVWIGSPLGRNSF